MSYSYHTYLSLPHLGKGYGTEIGTLRAWYLCFLPQLRSVISSTFYFYIFRGQGGGAGLVA